MTEAEILAVRIGLTGLIVSVVSVSFGMVSAYIVGLWLFLRRTPLVMRALAFALLLAGLGFMGFMTWGMHEMMLGTDRAWTKLTATASEITSFGGERPPALMGLTLYEFGALAGAAAFAAIVGALAYVTFAYDWRDE